MTRGISFAVAAWLLAQGLAQAQPNLPQGRSQTETLPAMTADVAGKSEPPISVRAGTTVYTMQGGDKKDGAPVIVTGDSCGSCGSCGSCQPCHSCNSCCGGGPEVCGPPGAVWVSGEYLLWWTRGMNVPALVTSSNLPGPSITEAGFLGAPGTEVLYGDNTINNGSRSGWRFTAGAWLNDCHTIGIQARYFQLADLNSEASFSGTDYQTLYRPFYNVQTGRNGVFVIEEPAAPVGFTPSGYTGQVDISTYSRFYGMDVDFIGNLACGCNYRVDALIGWRYLTLQEGIHIHDIERNNNAQGFTVITDDRFDCNNVFNGVDLGVSAEYRSCKTVVIGFAKVALGTTHRTVNIQGSSDINPGAGASTITGLPGGVLAQQSNIGRSSSNEFSAVPEIGVNFAYQVSCNIRAMVGYSFIYWPNVQRPGDQIDTSLNLSQFPSTAGPGTLVGEAAPSRTGNNTFYWVHGLNFGLELRF